MGTTHAERGRYIALEGIDASGKSTQARLLAERLNAVLTREPGGTELGERLREMVLRHPNGTDPLASRAEVMLFCADRAQHLDAVVAPALASGKHVVSDRSFGSTLAYQGFGRGFSLDELRGLVAWASEVDGEVFLPELVVLLDLPVAGLVARREAQLRLSDRFESAPERFIESVASGYRQLAAADPDRWVVVDAAAPIEAVANSIWAAVAERLNLGGVAQL